jgi:hypothetical protein
VRCDFESGVIVAKNEVLVHLCNAGHRETALSFSAFFAFSVATIKLLSELQKHRKTALSFSVFFAFSVARHLHQPQRAQRAQRNGLSLSLRSLRSLWQHFFINHKPPEVESKSAKMMMCVMMHFDKDNCA